MRRLFPLLSLLTLLACQTPPSPDPSAQAWQAVLSDSLTEFAPGIISTGHEFAISFMPDLQEVYFTRMDSNRRFFIYQSLYREGQWQSPRISSFSGQWRDADPFISPDGERLYFMSFRPLQESDTAELESPHLWYVIRQGKSWSEAVPVDANIRSEEFGEGFPSVDQNYNLYFPSMRRNGQNDIWYAAFEDGRYLDPILLPESVNDTAFSDSNPVIDPFGERLFYYSNREDAYGAADLYTSKKLPDGSWTPAQNLGPSINSAAVEYCPALSPDGKLLFFTRRALEGEDPLRIYYRQTAGLY
ncbi:MAG: hypothetical protein AAF927_22370 [Bacteroidota bacterium]